MCITFMLPRCYDIPCNRAGAGEASRFLYGDNGDGRGKTGQDKRLQDAIPDQQEDHPRHTNNLCDLRQACRQDTESSGSNERDCGSHHSSREAWTSFSIGELAACSQSLQQSKVGPDAWRSQDPLPSGEDSTYQRLANELIAESIRGDTPPRRGDFRSPPSTVHASRRIQGFDRVAPEKCKP